MNAARLALPLCEPPERVAVQEENTMNRHGWIEQTPSGLSTGDERDLGGGGKREYLAECGNVSVSPALQRPFEEMLEEMIDLEDLLERIDQDRELLRELLNLLLTELPTLHTQLRRAVETGSVRTIQAQAHTLKGMLANLAVTNSAATAALIEQQARADDQGGIATSMAELNRQVARLMPALEAYLADFDR